MLGRTPETLPAWPPDVFAVPAIVLKRTGAYLRPVADNKPAFSWDLEEIGQVARDWRVMLDDDSGKRRSMPGKLLKWWSDLIGMRDMRIDDLLAHARSGQGLLNQEHWLAVVSGLRKLLIAADEACQDAGLLGPWLAGGTGFSAFYLRCAGNLFWRWWRSDLAVDP